MPGKTDIGALIHEQVPAILADLSDVKGRLGCVELSLTARGKRVGALTRTAMNIVAFAEAAVRAQRVADDLCA